MCPALLSQLQYISFFFTVFTIYYRVHAICKDMYHQRLCTTHHSGHTKTWGQTDSRHLETGLQLSHYISLTNQTSYIISNICNPLFSPALMTKL